MKCYVILGRLDNARHFKTDPCTGIPKKVRLI